MRKKGRVVRHEVGAFQWVGVELHPRALRQTIGPGGKIVDRHIEAHCRFEIGPVGQPVHVFEPKVLARLGWALLTASHKLARLQGGETIDDIDDSQLTIYDALEWMKP